MSDILGGKGLMGLALSSVCPSSECTSVFSPISWLSNKVSFDSIIRIFYWKVVYPSVGQLVHSKNLKLEQM